MKQKNHTIKRRILEIIEYKGYRFTNFFETFKSSTYNSFKGEKALDQTVSSEVIAEILEIFPEINPYWLITGKGEMLQANIGDRFRSIIKQANLDIDYLTQYLGVNERFIETTDFLNIHKLHLISKMIPTLSEKWLLTGEGSMYLQKAKPSKRPIMISEDEHPYNDNGNVATIENDSFDALPYFSDKKDFSKRIQKLLEYLMMNPTSFAKACGFSKNMMVQFWLDGKYEPSPQSYLKILERYPALNRNWLMFGEGSMWTNEDYFRAKFNEILESDRSKKVKRKAGEIIDILMKVFECSKSDLAKRMGISVITLTRYQTDSNYTEFTRKIISTIHRNIEFIPKDWLGG